MSDNEQALDLDAIRARADAVTPGPWGVDGPAQCGPADTLTIYSKADGGAIAYAQPLWADAEFIAHAREDVPALLDLVKRLTAERDDARASSDAYSQALSERYEQSVLNEARLRSQRDGLAAVIEQASIMIATWNIHGARLGDVARTSPLPRLTCSPRSSARRQRRPGAKPRRSSTSSVRTSTATCDRSATACIPTPLQSGRAARDR